MLTRNGKTLFTQSMDNSGYPADRVFINTNRDSAYTSNLTGGSPGARIGLLMAGMTLVVGDGSTEPTADDISLENIVSSLSVVTESNSGNRSISYDDNFMYTLSKTFKNNTNSPVTITELGAYSQSSQNFGVVMYAREVISPVTIQPSAVYTFSMTIG